MLDDGPPQGFNAQGIASAFRPHPALEVASRHLVVAAVVADGPIEPDAAGFIMREQHLEFCLRPPRDPEGLRRLVLRDGPAQNPLDKFFSPASVSLCLA